VTGPRGDEPVEVTGSRGDEPVEVTVWRGVNYVISTNTLQ
jgi:hypothetical protein